MMSLLASWNHNVNPLTLSLFEFVGPIFCPSRACRPTPKNIGKSVQQIRIFCEGKVNDIFFFFHQCFTRFVSLSMSLANCLTWTHWKWFAIAMPNRRSNKSSECNWTGCVGRLFTCLTTCFTCLNWDFVWPLFLGQPATLSPSGLARLWVSSDLRRRSRAALFKFEMWNEPVPTKAWTVVVIRPVLIVIEFGSISN